MNAIAEELQLHDQPIQVLNAVLHRLAVHYTQPETEEIAVCAPGVLFVKLRSPDSLGRIWQQRLDTSLTHRYLMHVLHTVSCTYNIPFHPPSVPTLFGSLPGGHRIAGACGPGIIYTDPRPEGGVCLSIRQAPREDDNAQLEDWGVRPGTPLGIQRTVLRRVRMRSNDAYDAIFEAARADKPMLFSGPTGSGKTRLFNRLLRELDPNFRVISVEDTLELQIPNKNRVCLYTPRAIDPDAPPTGLTDRAAIDLLMRLTPDVILVGEISTSNASMALELMHSGHKHFWTSIHAASPEDACITFAKRVQHVQTNVPPEQIAATVRKHFFIVQVHTLHAQGQRIITDIVPPTGH